MSVLDCPKHRDSSWVNCCFHVAGAARENRRCSGVTRGPRRPPYYQCACANCLATDPAFSSGAAVCSVCFTRWWAEFGTDDSAPEHSIPAWQSRG